MTRLLPAILLLPLWLSPLRADTPPLTAPEIRGQVLRAIFPSQDIVPTTRQRDDSGRDVWMSHPDAFGRETVYQVNGPATDETERCASEDLLNKRFSQAREVRFQVFAWPSVPADLLAVMQYSFIGANPAGSCWSIGLIAHLVKQGEQWDIVERRLVGGQHHVRMAAVRLVDLTGDNVDELVLEPDHAGTGSWGTSILVFDLKGRALRPVLDIPSRLEEATDNYFTEFLDLYGSRRQAGKAFCFRKTEFVKDGKIYRQPRVTFHCVPAGTGIQ